MVLMLLIVRDTAAVAVNANRTSPAITATSFTAGDGCHGTCC